MKCDDCVYAEITDWKTDHKTEKAIPILWCEKHRKHCEDVNVKCEYYDDAKGEP